MNTRFPRRESRLFNNQQGSERLYHKVVKTRLQLRYAAWQLRLCDNQLASPRLYQKAARKRLQIRYADDCGYMQPTRLPNIKSKPRRQSKIISKAIKVVKKMTAVKVYQCSWCLRLCNNQQESQRLNQKGGKNTTADKVCWWLRIRNQQGSQRLNKKGRKTRLWLRYADDCGYATTNKTVKDKLIKVVKTRLWL